MAGCSCGKKNCACGGKHSKTMRGKYAEGGAVTPVQNPASGPFAQGSNKYLTMIQQGRANARSSLSTRNPADIVNKYFPPPPPPAAATAPSTVAPVAPKESNRDRDNKMNANRGPKYTGVKDMFDGGGPGTAGKTFKGGPLSGTLNKVGVKPIGDGKSVAAAGGKVGKPRGGR